MKHSKKLESLKSTTFNEDFSQILGGHNSTPRPQPTGDLRPIYDKKTGQIIDYNRAPEGPGTFSMG